MDHHKEVSVKTCVQNAVKLLEMADLGLMDDVKPERSRKRAAAMTDIAYMWMELADFLQENPDAIP